MKTTFFLQEADQQRLQSILQHLAPGPWPNSQQATELRKILSKAAKSEVEIGRGDHIGFNDRISLVSPADPRDSFDFSIVMPAESDPDHDRISILLPVSLASVGRRCGDIVTWECPRGIREMRISAVVKSDVIAV